MEQLKSYSSESVGVTSLIREARALFQAHSRDVPGGVRERLRNIREVEAQIKDTFDFRLEDRDVLEVGPGQFLMQMTYLSIRNRTVGIDTDIIVRGFRPYKYARMLRSTGLKRTAKTVFRKMLGIDRQYALELMKQLNLKRLTPLPVHPMNVCQMSFEARCFDFVYCRSVLHTLRDPLSAVEEIERVLRPGGVAYISVHPYTSQTGCLDPRMYTSEWKTIEPWSHLRPRFQNALEKPNVHLNRLRLHEWRQIFEAAMPGVQCMVTKRADQNVLEAAQALQRAGELLNYSIDELVAGEFAALWQKPADPNPGTVRRTQ